MDIQSAALDAVVTLELEQRLKDASTPNGSRLNFWTKTNVVDGLLGLLVATTEAAYLQKRHVDGPLFNTERAKIWSICLSWMEQAKKDLETLYSETWKNQALSSKSRTEQQEAWKNAEIWW